MVRSADTSAADPRRRLMSTDGELRDGTALGHRGAEGLLPQPCERLRGAFPDGRVVNQITPSSQGGKR
jgi:hypothetical protein